MNRLVPLLSTVGIVLALGGCSNDPTATNISSTTTLINFVQIDRVGRPGIKELYLPYANHDTFNRAAPTTDVAQVGPQIDTFVTGTGGRAAGISQFVQQLLVPDALVADIANPATRASYLGFETSGQIASDCNGAPATSFGGRSLTDDVVNAMLGLTFGSLATRATIAGPTPNLTTAAPPDDNAEQDGRNGRPNLTKQFAGCANKGLTLQQFPYLGAPL